MLQCNLNTILVLTGKFSVSNLIIIIITLYLYTWLLRKQKKNTTLYEKVSYFGFAFVCLPPIIVSGVT